MALRDIIGDIMDEVRQVNGIRHAPQDPPSEMHAFPFAVALSVDGVWQGNTPEDIKGRHNVEVQVHVALKADLPRVIEDAMRFSDEVPLAIYRGLRNAQYVHFEAFQDITYEFGPLGWGNTPTVGFRFTVRNIKRRKNL